MEKENVLEIEITKINDEWSAITITKLDEALKNNDMFNWRGEDTEFNFFERKFYINPFHPYQPFLILNQYIECVETIIDEINKKYGIPKRWRAKEGEEYYFLDGKCEIWNTNEIKKKIDDVFFEQGNYFKTKEEAEKVKIELDKFWERVRNGEIGGEE